MAFRCPNCGGSAVFEVSLGKVKCQHCDSIFDPALFNVKNESREQSVPEAEVRLFSCQSCGAELQGTEDSVVGFCPYCGGQSMLDRGGSSIGVEHIVPFRVSREQCAELYRQNAKKVKYLPKELTDPRHLESFTGIYMPYYEYDVEMGAAHITGTKTVESNSRYEVVNTYQIQASVDGGMCQVPYDASRYLDDEIAARTLPFDMSQRQPFNPAFLSGFYADASTVPPETYLREAEKQASSDMVDEVADEMALREGIDVEKESSYIEASTRGWHSALLPMWFLTWRRDDRVAYAVVNGDTGKVVSDLPVDMKAFGVGCAVISIIIFAILELLFQPTPLITSIFSLIAAAVMAISVRGSTKRLFEKQTHANDKGWSGEEVSASAGQTGRKKVVKKKKGGSKVFLIAVAVIAVYAAYDSVISNTAVALPIVIGVVSVLICIFCLMKIGSWQGSIPEKQPTLTGILITAAAVLNTLIVIVKPVNDVWYYLGDAVCILILIFAAVAMTGVYNLGTMRPLPKLFDRNEVGS